jgi:hypothetical protein
MGPIRALSAACRVDPFRGGAWLVPVVSRQAEFVEQGGVERADVDVRRIFTGDVDRELGAVGWAHREGNGAGRLVKDQLVCRGYEDEGPGAVGRCF